MACCQTAIRGLLKISINLGKFQFSGWSKDISCVLWECLLAIDFLYKWKNKPQTCTFTSEFQNQRSRDKFSYWYVKHINEEAKAMT